MNRKKAVFLVIAKLDCYNSIDRGWLGPGIKLTISLNPDGVINHVFSLLHRHRWDSFCALFLRPAGGGNGSDLPIGIVRVFLRTVSPETGLPARFSVRKRGILSQELHMNRERNYPHPFFA